jgi:hypothetical protein
MPEVRMRLTEYSRGVANCTEALTNLHAAVTTISGSLHKLKELNVQVGVRPEVANEMLHLLEPLKAKLASLG